MKKLAQIAMIAFGMTAIVACNNDDSTTTVDPPATNHLIGTWKLDKVSMKYYENDELTEVYENQPVGEFVTMEFSFQTDNTVNVYLFVDIPEEPLEQEISGTYTHTGNDINITIEGETQTFTVLHLDASDLHLSVTDEYEEDGVNYREESVQKFIKKP